MPNIFDNIDLQFLPELQSALSISSRADFCVGYFNLRGWKELDKHIEHWTEEHGPCRLLIGMQRPPSEMLDEALNLMGDEPLMDLGTANQLKKNVAREFRKQLTFGTPTNADEKGLRMLAKRLREEKLIVKLFLKHPLHAKLYLVFRDDRHHPIMGYSGSSNLTMSGLVKQGELNIDVMDGDACKKLAQWFEDRWNEKFCLDISKELIDVLEESWAREELIPPYHIYIKMAYHLSEEARAGLTEFKISSDFDNKLFEFQQAAVQIAAHHVNKRDGVLIGDVVGLGKTLIGTALARIFEDDMGFRTLIIAPKALVPMWKEYREAYGLRGKVMSLSKVETELPEEKRYQLVIIDESHNLRNREGMRYRIIHEYIQTNSSKVILLTATPYNKTYEDLSNQLRLFVNDEIDIGIRPEQYLKKMTESEFRQRHQCSPRSLQAFDKSDHPDDWRDLMRLYLVRRTRGFIKDNYAHVDETNGRKYLLFPNGNRSYFPDRVPKTLSFKIDETNPDDQYARLYSEEVVDVINGLSLPRYGLGNYIDEKASNPPRGNEEVIVENLGRAGRRLMGFCRTNMFKRLESSGHAFILSIKRHILRNYIFQYALENGLDIPIGTQDTELLDLKFKMDSLYDDSDFDTFTDDGLDEFAEEEQQLNAAILNYRSKAEQIYELYRLSKYKGRFKWLRTDLFKKDLIGHLEQDSHALIGLLSKNGEWFPEKDEKLRELVKLLSKKHKAEKVLVFSQFADTVHYVTDQLQRLGLTHVEAASGQRGDPTDLAGRFSPKSQVKKRDVPPDKEIRVLVSTDILSEGQNLQDCCIVVNYDLPWAIIRLIQRAGRVDRIGQQSEQILCYSFFTADGVERIIRLRNRVRARLRQNQEVVGADEAFFEDMDTEVTVRHLYTETSGILDGEDDREVDLASQAYQIWKNATDADASLRKEIEALPDVVFSARAFQTSDKYPPGALVYIKTAHNNDALAYIDHNENSITESQVDILRLAACSPDTPALPRHNKHHDMVRAGKEHVAKSEQSVGGELGSRRGARHKTYIRLKKYIEDQRGSLFEAAMHEVEQATEELYKFPLTERAAHALNRELRSGISDQDLADMVVNLRNEGTLCNVQETASTGNARIVCSLGLIQEQ